MENFDDIIIEVEKRLKENTIPNGDKVKVETWLKMMKSDIPQMVEVNAKLLSNYLKKGLAKTEEDAINYKEVSNTIFEFLDTNKNLDENIVNILKSYMIALNDDKISNKEKNMIVENFWNIRRNVKYREKSMLIIKLINEKYKENVEYSSYLYELFKTINDDTKPLIERKNAEIEINDILKYENELLAVQTTNKIK